jgi:hypothetical protein
MDLAFLIQVFAILVTLLGNVHALLNERRTAPFRPRLYRYARL